MLGAACLQQKRRLLPLPLLLGFNGPATEAEPQIIIMRENEIHIGNKEEGKVDKERRENRGRVKRKEKISRRKGGLRNDGEIPLHL